MKAQKTLPGNCLTENSTPKRRKNTAVEFDKEKLPEEASAWSTNQTVRLVQKNGGQIIKEFLANNEIQRPTRAPRRAKKKTHHGVSFPMHAPATAHKQTIKEKIENKEILIGKNNYSRARNKVISCGQRHKHNRETNILKPHQTYQTLRYTTENDG